MSVLIMKKKNNDLENDPSPAQESSNIRGQGQLFGLWPIPPSKPYIKNIHSQRNTLHAGYVLFSEKLLFFFTILDAKIVGNNNVSLVYH